MIEDYLDTLSNLFIKELVCILLLLRVCVHMYINTLQKMKIVIKINSAVWNTSEEMKNRVRNLSCPRLSPNDDTAQTRTVKSGGRCLLLLLLSKWNGYLNIEYAVISLALQSSVAVLHVHT